MHASTRTPTLLLALFAALAGPATAATLVWDVVDGTNQVIEDGSGVWSGVDPFWNDATTDNTNVVWDNVANAGDVAVFGAGGTAGTVTNPGAINLAGLTFEVVTGSYAIVGGDLTAPGGTLSITNLDTGNDRRFAAGALIGARLTGAMHVVFAGAGDNVTLSNAANDFAGEIRFSGGGVSIAADSAFGQSTNAIAVVGPGSTLRNTSAITLNRDVTFGAGGGLSLVNGGNVLTLAGAIGAGDGTSQLTIGAGHGNSYNHTVWITGTNTMAGTIRVYNVLRAYEGVGLSTNANILLGDYLDFAGANANSCGFLETSGDFIRALGAGANQFQWESTGNYKSGGFSAVGNPLAISLGGTSTPAALTWNTTTGFLKTAGELRLQNASATHELSWKNPINLNGALRVIYANSVAYPAILEGVVSGTGASGISKEGSGVLRLTATNTYSGITTISNGVVEATVLAAGGSDCSIGRSSNAASNLVFGAATATLRYIGTNDVLTDRGFTTSSGAGGGATLESSGSGTWSLDDLVPVSLGVTNQPRSLTLGGTQAGINTLAKTLGNNGTGVVSLVKAGSGRWVLTGTNSFTGATTINGGALRIAAPSALGTTNGNTTVGTTGLVELAVGIAVAEPLNLQGNNGAALADRIANAEGTNTLAGTISISTGGTSYGFRSDGGRLLIATNIVRGNATGLRYFFLRGAGEGEIAGTISGAGYVPSVIKEDAGTWTLSGVSTYGGTTTVSAGTLLVHGSISTGTVTVSGGTLGGTGTIGGAVVSSATVAPGPAVGKLTVAGAYSADGAATLAIELAGTSAGAHDVLAVGGAAALNGTLTVVTNGYAPANGDVFIILTAGSISGTFSTTNLPALGAGLIWNVGYLADAVVLSVTNEAPVLSGYDLWAVAITNGLTNYNDSATGDGYPNLLKYATGSNPTNADTLAHLLAGWSNGLLTARFNRSATATDVTVVVEGAYAADDGAPWTGLATNQNGSWGAAMNVVENTNATPIAVSVTDPAGAATNRFIRLRVTRP